MSNSFNQQQAAVELPLYHLRLGELLLRARAHLDPALPGPAPFEERHRLHRLEYRSGVRLGRLCPERNRKQHNKNAQPSPVHQITIISDYFARPVYPWASSWTLYAAPRPTM